jgi:spermidine synthase
LVFAASGCAALIYEMAWFHQVQLVVGASSLSVAVILCSFMGGMAAGSWLAPKVTPAGSHPLRAIAAIEGAIAAFGVLIPFSLPLVQQAYVAMVGQGFGAVLLRAAVCMLVLTPPTMLMGATLPVMATWRGGGGGAGGAPPPPPPAPGGARGP